MVAFLEEKQAQIADLCRKYGVRRLDVFGSAAVEDQFDSATSDVDFLVEFDHTQAMGPADQYFGLLEDLRHLVGRDVDLISSRSLRNPYFIKSVHATRRVLYAS